MHARRIVQPELVTEPRIVAAEDLAQPVEGKPDRTGVQAVGERNQVKRDRYPQVDFQRHGGGFDHRVAAEQSDALSGLDQHAVGEGIVAVVRDASARHDLLPTIPQPGLGEIVFRLQEEMLFQIISCRQAVLANVVLGGDRNEMKLPELAKPDVGRLDRAEN